MLGTHFLDLFSAFDRGFVEADLLHARKSGLFSVTDDTQWNVGIFFVVDSHNFSQLAAKKGIENSATVAEDSTSEKHPRIFWLPEEWAEDDRWGRFCRRENVFPSADFWLIPGDGLNLLTEKARRNPVNKIFVPILRWNSVIELLLLIFPPENYSLWVGYRGKNEAHAEKWGKTVKFDAQKKRKMKWTEQ